MTVTVYLNSICLGIQRTILVVFPSIKILSSKVRILTWIEVCQFCIYLEEWNLKQLWKSSLCVLLEQIDPAVRKLSNLWVGLGWAALCQFINSHHLLVLVIVVTTSSLQIYLPLPHVLLFALGVLLCLNMGCYGSWHSDSETARETVSCLTCSRQESGDKNPSP